MEECFPSLQVGCHCFTCESSRQGSSVTPQEFDLHCYPEVVTELVRVHGHEAAVSEETRDSVVAACQHTHVLRLFFVLLHA